MINASIIIIAQARFSKTNTGRHVNPLYGEK